MNKFFTKFLMSAALLLALNTTISAQTLTELPNPDGISLSYFLGGENSNLFFNYYDNSNYLDLPYYCDSESLSAIGMPDGYLYPYFAGTYDEISFFTAYDANFNYVLLEYNGTTVEPLALPANYQYGGNIGVYDGVQYFALYDASFFYSMFSYDGTTLTEVPLPSGFVNVGTYAVEFNNELLMSIGDSNYNNSLFSFDGSDFTQIDLPENLEFSYFAYDTENTVYVNLVDNGFNYFLYQYDGADFTAIDVPSNYSFNTFLGENEDVDYLSFYDQTTFATSIFVLEDNTLTQVETPAGYDYPGYITSHNGNGYFSFYDLALFNAHAFMLDGSYELVPLNAPADYYYYTNASIIDDKPFLLYQDLSYNPVIVEITNDIDVTVIDNPTGTSNAQYITTADNKILLSYFIANERTLYIFNGTDFDLVENPDGEQLGYLQVNDNDLVYLSYYDQNFFYTLYKLRLNAVPFSENGSVTTDQNIPYFFNANDFAFADDDEEDGLVGIMITELETVGVLLNNGAHVEVGDFLTTEEIISLIFVPQTDAIANNYDYFRFKVYDGDAFSDEDYLMVINVVEPGTVANNELLTNVSVNVYPVPVQNQTTLSLESTNTIGAMTIYMLSSNGQLVMNQKYDINSNSFQTNLDLGHLSNGTYFLFGTSEEGKISHKIVVQH